MADRFSRRRSSRRFRLAALAVVAVFVISISTIVTFYTDMLWYREVGITSVFWTILRSKVFLAAIFGVAFFLFAMLNLLMVPRMAPSHRMAVDPSDPLERYRGAFLPYYRWAALAASAFLGLIFALSVTPAWERIMLAINSVPFGTSDPVFGRDVGFYVFKLPFYQFLYGWAFTALVIVTLMTLVAHYATGGIRPQSPGERVTPQVKAHLSALLVLLALLRAWGYRLDQFNLLSSTRGDITGASYTDLHAVRPALTLLILISLIVAGLFLVNIRRRGWALPLAGVGLWLLVSILARGVFPYVVQTVSVKPQQLQKETPYLKRTIAATRNAYGLDGISVKEYSGVTDLTRQAVDANPATINNIRLWDPDTLSTALRQLQEIRTYYQFADVDVDRYTVNGKLRQVMLSARELNSDNVPTRAWQNVHLLYTHGYGAVVSAANEVASEGGPTFLVDNIPPKSSAAEIDITRPGVYFGEGLTRYSIVRSKQRELDYPNPAGGDEFTHYDGKGGVRVSGFLRRLAFAWRFRDVNIAISGLIDPDTKILYFRQVQERLQKAAPFLRFDGDPYPVITGGRLVWIADAYTLSDMYPYSQKIDFGARTVRVGIHQQLVGPVIEGRYNYIRNSVKATVDAYDGTIKFYVWDPKDPVIGAWRKVFPKLFADASGMPSDLSQHVRYPEDLFRIQSAVYTRYHMTDPQQFFSGEDQWTIPPDPNERAGSTASVVQEIQPYYLLMRLPGGTKEEYVLILPFKPAGDKFNMIAYMAAKSGPEDYGKLVDFRFPKDRNILGISQVASRINAVEEISKTISLLDQRGSKVVRGNLLVIPIADSILYVQPLFVQAESNPIPELRKVIVATNNDVKMGNSLAEALNLILSGGPTVVEPGETPATSDELVAEAIRHFDAADKALQQGDLATFAREYRAGVDALKKSRSKG